MAKFQPTFQTLLEMYSDHDNKAELWKDMFCRLVKGSDPLYASSIYRLSNVQCVGCKWLFSSHIPGNVYSHQHKMVVVVKKWCRIS